MTYLTKIIAQSLTTYSVLIAPKTKTSLSTIPSRPPKETPQSLGEIPSQPVMPVIGATGPQLYTKVHQETVANSQGTERYFKFLRKIQKHLFNTG